ncbi:hypothetical protein FRB90_006485, partial [Tulasnella sp. 427]
MALPFGAHVPFTTQNPSPLSFGFGLGVPQHHLPPSPSAAPSFATQFTPQTPTTATSTTTPQRPPIPPRTSTKRRAEFDEQEDDAAMGEGARSPSPSDRPIRRLAGGKKLRMTPGTLKVEGKIEEEDVDVGSLLASLPPSSHLPLLTSLINERPELKLVVLSLIPRPTLDTAVQAINAGAKKLKDAYPYSVPPPTLPGSLGFGFGSTPTSQPAAPTNPMRDSYVRTRLRQPVKDFSKLLLSYMSYFSSTPAEKPSTATPSASNPAPSAQSSQQRQPTVPLHPTETFTFLQTVTSHVLKQPPLTIAELTRPTENVVFPRLAAEWSAWVNQINQDVNHLGKMYRGEVVAAWDRSLDELVEVEEQMLRSLQQHQ